MLLLYAKPMIIVIIAFIYVSIRFSTENCNDWPRTLVTGGCLLLVFAPVTGLQAMMMMIKV